MATPTLPPDPVELVRSLDAGAIRARLEAMDREREALRVLLRAAQRVEHKLVERPRRRGIMRLHDGVELSGDVGPCCCHCARWLSGSAMTDALRKIGMSRSAQGAGDAAAVACGRCARAMSSRRKRRQKSR